MEIGEVLQCLARGLVGRREDYEASGFEQAGEVIERGLDRGRDVLQNFTGDDEVAGVSHAGVGVHDVETGLAVEEGVLVVETFGENFGYRSPIAEADAADFAVVREIL
jgi:hypothetical protein